MDDSEEVKCYVRNLYDLARNLSHKYGFDWADPRTGKLYPVPDQPFIVCPRCKLVSFSKGDIEHKYCGFCHSFHDDLLNDAMNRVTREFCHASGFDYRDPVTGKIYAAPKEKRMIVFTAKCVQCQSRFTPTAEQIQAARKDGCVFSPCCQMPATIEEVLVKRKVAKK